MSTNKKTKIIKIRTFTYRSKINLLAIKIKNVLKI